MQDNYIVRQPPTSDGAGGGAFGPFQSFPGQGPGGGFPGQGPGGGFPGQGPGGGFPGQGPGGGFPGQGPGGGFPGQGPGGGFPGQGPGFGGGFPGQGPGFGGGFPGQGPGGGDVGPPTGRPPSFIPSQAAAQQTVGIYAVDPGSIRTCRFRYVYLWLDNGQQFWAWLIYVGRRSVAGWRWIGFRWVYFGVDLDRISSFICF